MLRLLLLVALLGPSAPALADAPSRFVVAASTRADEQSPRRLFNAGLRAEESGNLARACQLFMAARLVVKASVADELYARGAALRLVRILAGRDDDAALAAALLIEDRGDSSDLGPLVRSLLKRFASGQAALELAEGMIVAARYVKSSETVVLELELPGGELRVVEAEGTIAPLSAGQKVRLLVKKVRGRAAAGWSVVALGRDRAEGWQLLRVDGLPGMAVASE